MTIPPWLPWPFTAPTGSKPSLRLISRIAGGETDASRDYEYTDWYAVERFARDFARLVEPFVTHVAANGHKTLVVSTDSAHSLADALEKPIGADATPILPKQVQEELDGSLAVAAAWWRFPPKVGRR